MNIARSLILLFAAQVAILAAAPAARADIVLFGLDSSTKGEVPNKVDPSKPSLLFKFEDTALDQVTVTFDATNLQPNNYISGVLFNLDTTVPFSDLVLPVGWTFFGTSTPPLWDGVGFSSFDAGLFNIAFGFYTDPNQGDLFNGGETRTAIFGRAGLRATDFLVTSIAKPAPDPSAGGFYAAAGIQGIQIPGGRVGSGAVGGNSYTVVPEPSSIILFALGGLGLAAFRSRRHVS